MNRWPHKLAQHSRDAIAIAVDNPEWQAFRRSLKGISTQEKLERLAEYIRINQASAQAWVCVDNYINSLRRGGQLDLDNNVQR